MKIEKRDGSLERRVLIGHLVDDGVCAAIDAQWGHGAGRGLYRTKWANIVGQWASTYYRKYGKAPAQAIQSIFEAWATDHQDKATIELVERFLASLSDQYVDLAKESNRPLTLDLAAEHFNKVRIANLNETLEGHVSQGDLQKALAAIHSFGKVELGVGAGIDVLQDEAAITRALKASKEPPLIEYPGAMGELMGRALCRDGFISFFGFEKAGKSFWLLDVAWRGLLARRKVAFFMVGDLSEEQVMGRFITRAARRPLLPAKDVKYPLSIEHDPDEPEATIQHELRNWGKPLSSKVALKACAGIMSRKVKSKDTYLRLSVHPTKSLSVTGMKAILQGWEHASGWSPDVIVCDYADIMAPVDSRTQDKREQVDATWAALRALSQERHCLVVTASQTNAQAYKVRTITRSNFSEDHRKLAHTTGVLGLSVTDEEKGGGCTRLNWIVLRGADYVSGKCVHAAGCKALANPCVKSCW